jgi:hypothetical protein
MLKGRLGLPAVKPRLSAVRWALSPTNPERGLRSHKGLEGPNEQAVPQQLAAAENAIETASLCPSAGLCT